MLLQKRIIIEASVTFRNVGLQTPTTGKWLSSERTLLGVLPQDPNQIRDKEVSLLVPIWKQAACFAFLALLRPDCLDLRGQVARIQCHVSTPLESQSGDCPCRPAMSR